MNDEKDINSLVKVIIFTLAWVVRVVIFTYLWNYLIPITNLKNINYLQSFVILSLFYMVGSVMRNK